MCKAKRMSPCCDDRIIPSGCADTACLFISLSCDRCILANICCWSYSSFCKPPLLSSLSSIGCVSCPWSWPGLLSCWKCYFHSAKASVCKPRTLLIHLCVYAICEPVHLFPLWLTDAVSHHSQFMSQRMADYFQFNFQMSDIVISVFRGDIEVTYFFWYIPVDCSVSSI